MIGHLMRLAQVPVGQFSRIVWPQWRKLNPKDCGKA